MGRQVTAKEASEHLGVLSRMLRQVEVDESLPKSRKKRIRVLVAQLMAEFQEAVAAE